MLLLVDIGNTQTVIGIHQGNELDADYLAKWRISTDKSDTADNIRAKLAPLFEMSGIALDAIHRAAVASVVPSLSISWDHALIKTWGINATFCNSEIASRAGLFEADYPNPSEIGSDRVADSIAAKAIFGSPSVVVDFGTATNIEVLDEKGRFIGGVIAPGIMTGADALFKNATLIATTGVAVPESVIGKSTSQAVQSGVLFGEVGRVDGLLDRIFQELGQKCPVVATEGLCHTVSRLSKNITDVSPELTLDGLRIMAEQIERND